MTASSYPPNVYGNDIPWEIPIQLCLGDVLGEGDCALDVGQAMSFYCDDSYYASASSFRRGAESWKEVCVPTISLDDYCRDHKLAPKAIKLDVEGAEFEVLRGAQWVLDRYAPSVVVEYYPPATPETDSIVHLKSRGYALYDTNLYREVDRDFYLTRFATPPLVNVLAISPAATVRTAYKRATTVTTSEVHFAPGTQSSAPLAFHQAGRYIVSTSFAGADDAMAILRVDDQAGRRLACYQTEIQYLRPHTCSNLIFQIDRPLEATCSISSPEGAAVSLTDVTLERIEFNRAFRLIDRLRRFAPSRRRKAPLSR